MGRLRRATYAAVGNGERKDGRGEGQRSGAARTAAESLIKKLSPCLLVFVAPL